MKMREPRVWLVPTLIIAAAAVLLATHGNAAMFHVINQARWVPDHAWSLATMAGDAAVLFALALLLVPKRSHVLPAILIAGALAGAWVQMLKFALDVPRPSLALDAQSVYVIGDRLWRHSFPSGHSATAFAAAGLCVLAFDPGAWSVVPIAMAAFVGLSRIAVGAHWPMDVLAGALGGWIAAALAMWLAPKLSDRARLFLQQFTAAAAGLSAGWLIVRPVFDTRTYPVVEMSIGVLCLVVFAVRARDWRRASESRTKEIL